MEIYDYVTQGGKNLILEYIDALPKKEKLHIFKKQKGKTEQQEIVKALQRARSEKLI